MSGQLENSMLAYLRRIDAGLTELQTEIADVRQRLTTVEIQIGQFAAAEQSRYVATMARFDRIEGRIERLERRADIVPA